MYISEAEVAAVQMINIALQSKVITLVGAANNTGSISSPEKRAEENASIDAKYIATLYSQLVANLTTKK